MLQWHTKAGQEKRTAVCWNYQAVIEGMIPSSAPASTSSTKEIAHHPKRKFEYRLEGLRGMAALVVVWFHGVSIERGLDPHFTLSGPLAYHVPGHLSVLLFFILSGYVIGITNAVPLTGPTVRTYLKKRFVRIYPIYAVAMLLTWAVAQPYPVGTWLAHLSLTHVLLAKVIIENEPAWSLHYEVVFYLLFIPVSLWRANAWPVAGGCVLLGVVNQLLWPTNTLLTCYCFGLAFWLCGLGLSQRALPSRWASSQFLVGMLLLLLSLHSFNIFETLLWKVAQLAVGDRLYYHYFPGAEQLRAVITFGDLAFLPVGALYILLFTNQDFPGRQYTLWALFGLPAATFLYLGQHHGQLNLAPYNLSSAFYVAAVALVAVPSARIEAVAARAMQRLVKLGGISYGLYIVHFPIMTGLRRVEAFSGTGFTYGVRFALYLLLSLLLAYYLEKLLQPQMRRLLTSQKQELAVPRPT
ncbi:acyltransferase family protein [Hymenobacter armeniacus]|uniref:Acyltransferase n=1 Tax=Hymenobacter armeniacus TaxID=2771358 RepID=A0ABR8JYL0_9BACT|nr:acyltransferase [Hymenobacter armeniacus]MBD2724046.1 acyltransferase [Hymenobacter armeniacus]